MKLLRIIRVGALIFRNLVLGMNLAALSLIPQPRRMLQYVWESLFVYRDFSGARGIPQKYPYEVLSCPSTISVNLGRLSAGGGLFPPASWTVDLLSLCLICQLVKPKVVFEIGTYLGHTTFQLAVNTPPGTKIYTLDLPPTGRSSLPVTSWDEVMIGSYQAQSQPAFFAGTEMASKIVRLYGDSATFDYSPYYDQVDMFFIDGAHSYQYVRSDTLNALKCCHPGSVIAWHDFGRVGASEGVSKWLLEFSRGKEVYSVPGGSIAFMVITG